MVTQNHFVIPTTVLEKFRSQGFPEGVTVTAHYCMYLKVSKTHFSDIAQKWALTEYGGFGASIYDFSTEGGRVGQEIHHIFRGK